MKFFKVFLLVFLAAFIPELVFAEKVFFFEGQADLSRNEFNIVLDLNEGNSITAKATRMSETNYCLSLDVDHLKTPVFDLISKIESSVDLVKGENGGDHLFDVALRGKIWSQYSLVDFKPINELSGRFEIKDKRLHVMALSVGNLTGEGYLDLGVPYNLDVAINLLGVDMQDFLNFWGSGKNYESSGDVFGEIKASGSLDRLVLKGSLKSRDGFVQELDYNAIVLNIEGIYPFMQIAHSTVSKADGVSFSLDGPFDLSDKTNFKKQIKALTLAPLVSDSGSELEWTIKRLKPEDSGITEFKYHLKKGNALGIGPSAGGEIDMLGIERTRKF
ncbi:MAG: hypothetical protein KAJ70_01030 [Candidatus Omnitrophica bacterium]|nr:hypothetical protein [Candidatus Omnitrophota bacterium]